MGDGKSTGGGGTPYYPPIDPGGLQTAGAGAGALAVVALVGSEAGPDIASALGLGSHAPQVLSAGISFANLANLHLFPVGLTLVCASVILNIASLVIRRQAHAEAVREYESYIKEEEKKKQEEERKRHEELLNHYQNPTSRS